MKSRFCNISARKQAAISCQKAFKSSYDPKQF